MMKTKGSIFGKEKLVGTGIMMTNKSLDETKQAWKSKDYEANEE